MHVPVGWFLKCGHNKGKGVGIMGVMGWGPAKAPGRVKSASFVPELPFAKG